MRLFPSWEEGEENVKRESRNVKVETVKVETVKDRGKRDDRFAMTRDGKTTRNVKVET